MSEDVVMSDASSNQRKRRRIPEEDEEDSDGSVGRSYLPTAKHAFAAPSVVPPSAPPIIEIGDEDSEEEIVDELASPPPPMGSPVGPSDQPSAITPRPNSTQMQIDDDEDEVQILASHISRSSTPQQRPSPAPSPSESVSSTSSNSNQQPPRKRPKVAPVVASVAVAKPLPRQMNPATPASPTAPVLEPLSPPSSPSAPPLSPISMKGQMLHGRRDLDAEERLAVLRAKKRARQETPHVPFSEPIKPAGMLMPSSSPPPTASNSGIRRRKAHTTATAAASSLASASLLHSYTGFAQSTVDPALMWPHEPVAMPLPSNPNDKMDVERTFLQQVLTWEVHSKTLLQKRPSKGALAGKKDGEEKDSNAAASTSSTATGASSSTTSSLAAFSKFLDLDVPLPTHFTTPLAYLGFFGPVVMENFRAQLIQTVEETLPIPQPRGMGGDKSQPSATVAATAAAERHRTIWTAMHMQACSSVTGGGEDWIEVRLKLIQPNYRAISQMGGADIVVLGIDTPPAIQALFQPQANKQQQGNGGALLPSSSQQPLQIPPPSSNTCYVFGFLDRLDAGDSAKVRLYLPGVAAMVAQQAQQNASSAGGTSSHGGLAPIYTPGSSKLSRFQTFFHRLTLATQASSNPIEEGGKNSSANFTPLGSTKQSEKPIYPIFMTRMDTTITTMREYTALIKISASISSPLRLQHELLQPTADADEREEEGWESEEEEHLEESNLSNPKKKLLDVSSPVSPMVRQSSVEALDLPPALESIEQVLKKKSVATGNTISLTGTKDSLAHLDSPAWIGLPSGFRDYIQTILNASQLKAVQVALKRYETPGFTLLQGPPGTGKSKTVVALLNALHLGAFQRHYDSLIANVVEGASVVTKPRILVCAPSNTAVDELITRVVESGAIYKPPTVAATTATTHEGTKGKETGGASSSASSSPQPQLTPAQALLSSLRGHGGFVDGSRTRYRPDIVRVGHTDSIRQELKNSISLDALVETYNRLTETDLQQRLQNAKSYIYQQEASALNAAALFVKSKKLFLDLKDTLDSLANLGHTDLRKQPQYQQFEKFRADYLQRQSELAHICEKRLQALQDHERCDWALRMKVSAKIPSATQARKEREQALDGLRISFLNGAQLVFCTLSGSGLDLLSRLDQPFQVLIIDEAAQSTEISAIIPLIHDVQHCVLVGDPRQLPATVFSQDITAKRMWERSLFERLEQAGHQIHSLTVQYRMHSDIRQFPSEYFYQNQLKDASFIRAGLYGYKQPYHPNSDFRPFLFYDLQSTSARGMIGEEAGRSLSNQKEAIFIVDLLTALLKQFPAPSKINPKQIGIITFYQKQRMVLQDELRKRAQESGHSAVVYAGNNRNAPTPPPAASSSPSAAAAAQQSAPQPQPPISPFLQIEVSTVDGFQGREKEIIIVSCVRGGATGGLGFVDDVRRMNVALTRAKFALWVVGDSRALKRSEHWSAFLESAQNRNRYQSVTGEEFVTYRPKNQQQHQQGRQQHQHTHQHQSRIQRVTPHTAPPAVSASLTPLPPRTAITIPPPPPPMPAPSQLPLPPLPSVSMPGFSVINFDEPDSGPLETSKHSFPPPPPVTQPSVVPSAHTPPRPLAPRRRS